VPVARLRIGLIADTHIPEAGPELWPQVFHAFRDVDAILHAGDVHDPGVLDALGRLAPVWAVRGNGDDGSGGRPLQPEHPAWRDAWLVELGGLRIAMLHCVPIPEIPPHFTLERALRRAFGDVPIDVLVYGDTHVEAVERIGGILCVNPGSPTLPHNLDPQLGTIGFLEVVGGAAEASIWQLVEDGPGIVPFDWRRWRR
jgi:putative phosphoesterase